MYLTLIKLRQSHQTSRSIRQEQDGAYEASLRADQEKAAKAQADREKAAKAKEEADRIAREKLTKAEMKEQRRKDIRESMKDEPLATDVGVTKLSLRFPSGSRLIRRFHSSDVIQSVYDFVDIQDLAPLPSEADFVLVNTYPRKIYSQMDQSLEEAGLVPTASLIVEERLPDAQ